VLDEVEENLILEMENIRLWQYRFKMAIEQASTWLRKSGEYRRCILDQGKSDWNEKWRCFIFFCRSMYEPKCSTKIISKNFVCAKSFTGIKTYFPTGDDFIEAKLKNIHLVSLAH
jgi:hypothetical protein